MPGRSVPKAVQLYEPILALMHQVALKHAANGLAGTVKPRGRKLGGKRIHQHPAIVRVRL